MAGNDKATKHFVNSSKDKEPAMAGNHNVVDTFVNEQPVSLFLCVIICRIVICVHKPIWTL